MALIGQAVSEEKRFENVDNDDDDGRTPDHGYTISSPCEPKGSGELKTYVVSAHRRGHSKCTHNIGFYEEISKIIP